MLGAVKSHKFYLRSFKENVYSRTQIAVYAARIGHKSDFFPLKNIESALGKDFDAGFHLCKGAGAEKHRQRNE